MTSAIAALQAGERHSLEDREVLRREIRDAKADIVERVNAVDRECKTFRREAREAWESRDKRSAQTTAAWIIGGLAAFASIVTAVISVTGAG